MYILLTHTHRIFFEILSVRYRLTNLAHLLLVNMYFINISIILSALQFIYYSPFLSPWLNQGFTCYSLLVHSRLHVILLILLSDLFLSLVYSRSGPLKTFVVIPNLVYSRLSIPLFFSDHVNPMAFLILTRIRPYAFDNSYRPFSYSLFRCLSFSFPEFPSHSSYRYISIFSSFYKQRNSQRID